MNFQKLFKACLLLIIVVNSISSIQCVPIVGGERVPDDDVAFSFAVSLQRKYYDTAFQQWSYKHFCGGVLLQVYLKTAFILSASHCVKFIKATDISVVFGAKSLRNYDGSRFNNVTVHKRKYDRFTMANDVCIIKVYFDSCDYPVLNPIRVVMDESTAFNDDCYIYGYGSESIAGDPTLDLRLAPVKIISYEQCMNELGSYNAPERNSGMFCAVGANPGVDACSGDSGSGFLCINNGILVIVGTTCYGLDCGVNNMPGVYTSAAYHADFIQSVISDNN